MSAIQFGLPLDEPSKQTILPYLTDSGRVYGFFSIASTTFQGTETTFTVAPGQVVNLKTVTLPPTVSNNLMEAQRVEQYMAAYFPSKIEGQEPWIGYSTLLRADRPNDLGYTSWWSMPVITVVQHFQNGTFIDAMLKRLDPPVPTASSQTPPPVTTPQALSWACSIDPIAFSPECAFFDFNWTNLFKTTPAYDPTVAGNTVIPISIQVVSNPAGGFFKAVIVQNAGQTIYPGGGVTFDTIRILRLQDPTPGTYAFNFSISYSNGTNTQTVPAVLNLTVV